MKAREQGMIQNVNVLCIAMAIEQDKSGKKYCSCQRVKKETLYDVNTFVYIK